MPSLHRTATRLTLPIVIAATVIAAAVGFSAPNRVHAASKPYVVVIDAGHQKKADTRTEPIGPGAKTRKPKVTAGTRGVATNKREATINLEVAKRLRSELEKRGAKVIMVRTKADVNISNSKRAAIANKAKADLFIRLHCDGAPKKTTRGFLTLVPGKNRWTGPIRSESLRAGKDIHAATLETTGAKSRGIQKRTDMSGFNWSKVPVVIVEMGVMTNAAEDLKLASASYQKKLASGIADGTMRYLQR